MRSQVHKSPTNRALAFSLLIVQVLLAAAAGYWVFMQTFLVAGCVDACGFEVVSIAWQAQLFVSLGSVVLSALLILVFYARGKETWWAPAVGIAVVLVTTIATTVAINVATRV